MNDLGVDENGLMARLAEGDDRAFVELYRSTQPRIYRYALQMTGSVSSAEEAVQEVFMILIQNPKKYNETRGTVGAYLFGVARNVVKRLGGIVAGILLLSTVLGSVTVVEFATNEAELTLQAEARAMLDEPEYTGLTYEGTTSEFDFLRYFADGGYEMEVVVGIEEGATVPPDLAQRLDDRLTGATGYEDLTVRVAFLDEQVST